MTSQPTEPAWDIPEQTWTIQPGDLVAVGVSRRRAIAATNDWWPDLLPDDTADAIRRVVSELVTNALRHASDSGPVTVSLWPTSHGNLVITVADGSPVPPTPREPYDDGTAGRGLAVVSADAISWGWRPTGPGKVVTATIRLPAPAATARRAPNCAGALPGRTGTSPAPFHPDGQAPAQHYEEELR